jgi:uncharacterized protein
MPPMNGDPHVQSMTRSECLAYLAGARMGRVGLTVGALPVIWPVRFVLAAGDVVFRAPPSSQLRAAAADAVVVFQADHHGEDTGIGWSVQAQGLCREVIHPAEIEVLRELPLPSWHTSPPGDSFLRLPLTRLTGKQVYW